MKIKKLLAAVALMAAAGAYAQNCTMPVAVVLDDDFVNVPAAASTTLYQQLRRLATESGLSSDAPSTPFVLTAHCDVIDKSNLPGPPAQTVYNLGLTLYLGDTYSQKTFATAYLPLNGVGTGEVKAYTNAFQRLSASNAEVRRLITDGKKRMMAYYDEQYAQIIKEAQRQVSLHNYEEALMQVFAIPVCSKGGDEAMRYGLEIYMQQLDRLNLFLLNRARALWVAGQDQATAYDVCGLLAQIDPDAKCYAEAVALMSEVKRQVRSDIDFEMRQKYNDSIALERDRIATARAVGVAFGNGQQPTTTNLMWMR